MVPVQAVQLWQALAKVRIARLQVLDALVPWWDGVGIHRHRIPTLVVALAGAARIETGERSHCDLAGGEAVLVQPWVWHSHPELNSGMALTLGWTHRQADTTVFWPGGRWEGSLPRAAVEQGLEALARAPAGRRAALATALVARLAELPLAPGRWPPAMRAMADYAWKHRTRPITVAALLATSGLGATAANRLFRDWFGTTPKQYLLACRMELAGRLLADGRPPGAIWRECGFASRAEFSRRFRLVHGAPPRRWRSLSRPAAG